MSNSIKAAEDIKNLAKRFQGFIEAAQYLEKIGSLEQCEAEAKVRKDKAISEANDAVAMADRKKQELKLSEDAIEQAKQKASDIEAFGQKRFSEIVQEAKEKASRVEIEAEKNKSIIMNEVEKKVNELNSLKKSIDDSKVELESIKIQIKEMKDKIAQFVR